MRELGPQHGAVEAGKHLALFDAIADVGQQLDNAQPVDLGADDDLLAGRQGSGNRERLGDRMPFGPGKRRGNRCRAHGSVAVPFRIGELRCDRFDLTTLRTDPSEAVDAERDDEHEEGDPGEPQ